MTPPHFSFDVNLGQVLITSSVGALGWGVRKSYKFLAHQADRVVMFVERINDNDELLKVTTSVVDEHTRVLIKQRMLKTPVVRLNRRKRSTDAAVFTEDDLS